MLYVVRVFKRASLSANSCLKDIKWRDSKLISEEVGLLIKATAACCDSVRRTDADYSEFKNLFDVSSFSKGLWVCNSPLNRVGSCQGSVYRVYAQLSSQGIEGSEGGGVRILQDIVNIKRVHERTFFNRNRCGNARIW